ncbi:MAG: tetratricopeptide repeat protein [Anaerolineales bacterium]|nr:MAG: tetratricopeptide repeat protein [Anaerolineales bacterium]
MANAEKVVDFVSSLLTGLIPKPADVAVKPFIKPVGDSLKSWLDDKDTKTALLNAAQGAESDFRDQAKDKFGNDNLTQAVASFPIHNGELFQAALQSLPAHFNETFLAKYISEDLSKYWSSEFSANQIKEATALYIDCLRVRLLRVNGFAEIVTRLAVLRTDRRTEAMQEDINWIRNKLSELTGEKSFETKLFLHQLPQPPADFTGRDELIEQLVADFQKGGGATIHSSKLGGLTGMGGIGKTALGLVVAHKIAENYPDAQIFLDLKGTTTPLSALEIARHVILSFEPTADLRALDENNFHATYQSVLHGKKALLFFDNTRSAEQIAPLRPPETCAMLVTSRWTFSAPGLQPRRVDVMSEADAMKFILELCPRVGDNAASLAKACAYLPLALRIAGSFLQVNGDWSADKYLAQLTDRKKRLETLKQSKENAELTTEPDLLATFELSYNSLKAEEQKRWRMLGVFPASFDATATSVMWDLDEDATQNSLSLFRRYSLIEFDENTSRYGLHDLLADYALEQMNEEEEQEARLKHATHYKEVMDMTHELYEKGNENILQGLNLFDREWEHIRHAQAWVAENIETSDILTELVMLYPNASVYCLDLRLPPRQKIQWLNLALDGAYKLNRKDAVGVHLGNLGIAYAVLGDARKAIEFYEQQLVIVREIGNRRGEGNALNNLGLAYAALGDARKAIEFYEQQLVIVREIGNRRGEGNALNNLGLAYAALGDARKAIEFYEQRMVIAREIGDRRGEGNALNNLGLAYAALGDARKAIEFYEQALLIAREIGDRRGEGNALNNLGLAYAALGDARKAIEFYEQQLVIVREIGNRRGEGNALGNLGARYYKLGDARKAIEFYEQALLIDREIGDRHGEGTTLGNLGIAYAVLGDARKAIEFYEQRMVIAREIGDRRGEENALGNLGNAYATLGDPHKAIEFYEQALLIDREIGDRRGEGNDLFNMGLALYGSKEKEKAIQFVRLALAIFEAIESPYAEQARNKLKEWGVLE